MKSLESVQNAEAHEQEPKLKKVFIEIGTNRFPITWLGTKRFGENETYIGIDFNPDAIKGAKKLTGLEKSRGRYLYFIQADAMRLPIGHKSTDEVFLGNVLGDPSITDREKDKFIEEAGRIIKEDGTIIIKETNTPADIKEVKRVLKRRGFITDKFFDMKSPTLHEELEPYENIFRDALGGLRPELMPKDSYILFAKPHKREEE